MEVIRQKFANLDYSQVHLLKALTYFENVKGTVTPQVIKKVSWQKITGTIRRNAEAYLKKLW